MRVIWTETNAAHIAEHGVSREEVEAVFAAPGVRFGDFPGSFRKAAEAEVGGRFLRVIFTESGPGEIYPLTAYQVSRRRRLT